MFEKTYMKRTYDIVNKLLSVYFHKFFKMAYENDLYFIIKITYAQSLIVINAYEL